MLKLLKGWFQSNDHCSIAHLGASDLLHAFQSGHEVKVDD